jgi:penicillin-binding protein 1A
MSERDSPTRNGASTAADPLSSAQRDQAAARGQRGRSDVDPVVTDGSDPLGVEGDAGALARLGAGAGGPGAPGGSGVDTDQPARARASAAAPAEARRRWPRSLAKVARRVAQVSLALTLVGAVGVFLVIRHYEARLPSVAQLKAGYEPPQVTRVLARDGTLLGRWYTERRTVISLDEVPNHVKLAFLAAEDAHFYEHEGLNYFGMLRALLANLRAGRTVQGGSTITQQVVKNLLLGNQRSYERKIRETILARRLEQNLTKDEILGLYLNHIYLGHGRYGIEEAARYYFGTKTKQLGLAEAAMLAGLVAAPERFSPRHASELALERRRYVLEQMLLKGFVTAALFRQASEAPLRLAPALEFEAELAPEVVSTARRLLGELVGQRAQRGGYVVTTTIDPTLQAVARRVVRENLDRYAERQQLNPPHELRQRRLWGRPFSGTPRPHKIYVGTVLSCNDRLGTIDVRVGDAVGRVFLQQEERYNPRRLPPSKFTQPGAALRVAFTASAEPTGRVAPLRLELGPQSALVAIDVRTRQVRALIGSYEALPGGLDRATRAQRQPGSAFKPFLYSYALHSRRLAPASILVLDDPAAESGTRRVSVREALAKSDNAAAERVLEIVGAANVVQWARALGIESRLAPTPSLALGAYEVTVLELANAFATFASGGTYASAVLVTKIVGPDGREIQLPEQPPARRVLEPEEAYLTTSLLQEVVRSGTGRRALSLRRPVAGKTGTTNDAKDAWFVGYSTEMVAAVWVGYDDALPLGSGEQGSVTALPGWIEFVRAAHERRPATDFARPSGVVSVHVDPATGLLPYAGQTDAVAEEFLPGSVPTQSAEPPMDADAGPEADQPADAQAPAPPSPPDADLDESATTGRGDAEPPVQDPAEEQPPPF